MYISLNLNIKITFLKSGVNLNQKQYENRKEHD